jgi:hypothetical protein
MSWCFAPEGTTSAEETYGHLVQERIFAQYHSFFHPEHMRMEPAFQSDSKRVLSGKGCNTGNDGADRQRATLQQQVTAQGILFDITAETILQRCVVQKKMGGNGRRITGRPEVKVNQPARLIGTVGVVMEANVCSVAERIVKQL